MHPHLSPQQRPLSCCFDRRLVVRGLGGGKNENARRNAGKEKERREASAIFRAVGWSDLQFGVYALTRG